MTVKRTVVFLVLLLLSCLARAAIDSPTFENPPGNVYRSGHVKLIWNKDRFADTLLYELQHSGTSDFSTHQTIYYGPDKATFISGLPNGIYYYRVRAQTSFGTYSPWSGVLEIKIRHHSLQLALTLAGLGLIVFLFTAAVLIHGVRKTKTAKI